MFPGAMNPFDAVVKKYVDRYGFEIQIIRNTTDSSNYDVDTGELVVNEEIIPCFGMIFDYTLQSNGTGNVSKTLIEAGDKQLLIQPPNKKGEVGITYPDELHPGRDKIVIRDDTYKIVTFKEVNPSYGNSCLWELYIRK